MSHWGVWCNLGEGEAGKLYKLIGLGLEWKLGLISLLLVMRI